MEPNHSLLGKMLLSSLLAAGFQFFRFYEPHMSMEQLMLQTYGIIYVREIKWGVPVMVWLIPLFLNIFFLGEYVLARLGQTTYIFTRTSNRVNWLLQQLFRLSGYVFCFHASLMIATGLFGLLWNLHIDSIRDVVVITVQQMVLLTLSCIVSITIVNVCTLAFHPVLSSTLVITLNVISLMISGALLHVSTDYDALVKWLPFTQSIYGWQMSMWHGMDHLSTVRYDLCGFAMLYLVGLGLIVVLVGMWRIHKMDIY